MEFIIIGHNDKVNSLVINLLANNAYTYKMIASFTDALSALDEKLDGSDKVTLSETTVACIINVGEWTGECQRLLHHPRLSELDVIIVAQDEAPSNIKRMIQGYSYFPFYCPAEIKKFSAFIELLCQEYQQLDHSETSIAPNHELVQFGLLRGNAESMFEVFRFIRKTAPTDASMLILGESGTGKELAARTIHQGSPRSEQPFLGINCGAIPKDLIESELFGHERGSFSGATTTHRGVFERAAGGTLLLDEISEMPLKLQIKLLRVLEEKTFIRLGGEVEIRADVRIIAASNREMQQLKHPNTMRQDLFYRLAQFVMQLPPLREREWDVVGLAQFFIHQLNQKHSTVKHLTHGAADRLLKHHWPGNIRELKNQILRAYTLAGRYIDESYFLDLDSMAPVMNSSRYLQVSIESTLDEVENKLIFATLQFNKGNKKRTAESLGISLKTLYNRLNKLDDEISIGIN